MSANTTPIFPLTPNVAWNTISAANTAKDGTGTVVTAFTAGSNGSRIDRIKIRSKGTNIATVMRFFINNGSSNATSTNNALVYEYDLLATTSSETYAQDDNDLLVSEGLDFAPPIPYLPAGYKINVTLSLAVSAGYQITVFGGDY